MASQLSAISTLGATLAGLLGKPVVYARGGASVILTAVVGRTQRETDDGSGFLSIVESRDYLLETANLILSGAATIPQPGDTITETLAGAQVVFTVSPIPGEPCFRYMDPLRTLLRIHTRESSSV